jgi:hypothetical protein
VFKSLRVYFKLKFLFSKVAKIRKVYLISPDCSENPFLNCRV